MINQSLLIEIQLANDEINLLLKLLEEVMQENIKLQYRSEYWKNLYDLLRLSDYIDFKHTN